jgi:hypothetical protein
MHRWDANIKMGLEDVECYPEEYLEVEWGFYDSLTITYRINLLAPEFYI